MAVPVPDLEAMGLSYMRRRALALVAPAASDPVHVLNPTEQAALRGIERGMVLRAAIAGALSGAASALAEVWATAAHPGAPGIAWAWIVGVTVAATAAEVGFLYWDALRSVHDLAIAAGVHLFPPGVSERLGTASALARAALELPNRPDPRLRVNPYREASRALLVAVALLYKVKIGLTTFLLKLLVRRLGGRALARTWAPLLAVPVTALWNAWVAWRVIREARLRAMGPSAAAERVARLVDARPPLGAAGSLAVRRAVACAVVGKRDLHPNLAALLALLEEGLGPTDETLDDRPAFLDQLRVLAPDERETALDLLAFALVLDGRLSGREREIWRQACAAVGRPETVRDLRRLRRDFVAGRPVSGWPPPGARGRRAR